MTHFQYSDHFRSKKARKTRNQLKFFLPSAMKKFSSLRNKDVFTVEEILIISCLLLTFLTPPCVQCDTTDGNSPCVSNCTCSGNHMICNATFPQHIPSQVVAVTVYAAPYSIYFQTPPFDPSSWQNVTYLDILPDLTPDGQRSVPNHQIKISNGAFASLTNLKCLKFSSLQLRDMEPGAFCGLDNLEVLDLSNNFELQLPVLVTGMASCSFSNLHTLSLRGLSKLSFKKPIFQSEFLNILTNVPLRSLDLSDINSGFLIFSQLPKTLDSLQYLNLEGSWELSRLFLLDFYIYMQDNGSSSPFDSLQELNLNDATVVDPSLFQPNIDIQLKMVLSKFPHNLRSLHLRGSISPDSMCEVRLTEHNNFFNVSFVFQPSNWSMSISLSSQSSLEYLDLSNNGIEVLSLNTTTVSNLRSINISYNNLNRTTPEVLARSFNFPKLKALFASHNRLTHVAKDIFARTPELQYVDLSHNSLSDFLVQLSHVKNLKVLNLSHNNIHSLSEISMNLFTAYFKETNFVENSSEVKTRIILVGNPIECSCDTLVFMEWLILDLTSIFVETPPCADGLLNITKESISTMKNDCTFKINIERIVGLTVGGILLFIMLTAGVLLVICFKKIRRKLKIQRLIKQYRTSPTRRTPVFLSYSSKNEEFVHRYVYSNLNQRLREMLNTGENCVITGDNSFALGRPVVEEIIRCIEESAVLLCCVSEDFCNSKWCKDEVFVAQFEKKPIVLMFLENVPTKSMPSVLQKIYMCRTRSKWTKTDNGEYVLIPGWDEVCAALSELIVTNTSFENRSSSI